ncbi:MAG: aspartyl-tRNA(Asn)/glutamyl-tRNA(Gln) amidotransferase subunit [Frankiales bacterium]|jgi:aspartyl-tRNA(Asn)/glutamyl-tRNA(Gln) amidotransferase subunit A|nr:aspartyl-tRNA(Asn)/glutamyl-tRNA(Gln) amidotransferase subunit [Frankiales bacterium]
MTTTQLGTADISAAADGLPLTITTAARMLRDGTTTSVALTRAVQARADVLDPLIGTYIARTDEAAIAAATQADNELAAGTDRGPLHGIPLGIKDIIATSDAPATAQSLILDPSFGEQGDAVVVARLRAAGAVITGKVTTMEYAIGVPDASKGFPTPRNPYDRDRWPGGSSSGTGNGVAAGLFLGGLGTDTGGSIRMPAAWCGISGLKATFGRVPKSGCVPLGFSYDNIGPMTRSARDCAAMLDVLAGYDESDSSCSPSPVDDYLSALTGDAEGLRIGVDLSFLDRPGCDPDNAALMHVALDVFRDLGATVVPVALPWHDELVTATTAGMLAEALAYHRADLQRRWEDYGHGTRMAVGQAALTLAADYVQAQRVRRVGVKAVNELFDDIDLILMPTCLVPAPLLATLDFGTVRSAILTGYWNAVGNPAISIPMGLTSAGLPMGLQMSGRPFEESTVLRAADAFQLQTGHHLQEPTMIKELLG